MSLKDMKGFKEELNSVGVNSWQDRLFTDWDAFNDLLSRMHMETSLAVCRHQSRVTFAHVSVPIVYNGGATTHVFWFVSQEQLETYKQSYQQYADDHPRFRQVAKNATGEEL